MNTIRSIARAGLAFGALLLPGLAGTARADSMTFTMEHFPPFNADDNGMSVGPLPDIVRATCAALKIQCVIETYPWRRAYRLAEEGKVDGIFVLLRTPQREKEWHDQEHRRKIWHEAGLIKN